MNLLDVYSVYNGNGLCIAVRCYLDDGGGVQCVQTLASRPFQCRCCCRRASAMPFCLIRVRMPAGRPPLSRRLCVSVLLNSNIYA